MEACAMAHEGKVITVDWSERRNAPSKIIGVRRNFVAAAPTDHKPVRSPWLFLKPSSAVIADGGEIEVPSEAGNLLAEAELAVVIGHESRDLQPRDVPAIVRGVTVANDVTSMDLFLDCGQLSRSKGLDGFCPLGRRLVPFSDIDAGVMLRCYVNGELRQEGNTNKAVFGFRETIAFISSWFTLWRGDVILLGTPGKAPPVKIGDIVKVEAEGIGSVTNRLIAKAHRGYVFPPLPVQA
jgi:2-keto-4-pentenoate hydratase/2-oxohepta-3-ene-1,7-dioic acid hydratase in catechol pathway